MALDRAIASMRSLLPAELEREAALILGYDRRSGSGYVVDTFWSACSAVIDASDYQDAVERGIRFGNDTDTTACVADGLAAAHWSFDAIPSDWMAGMRGTDIVEPLVRRLIDGT